MLTNEPERESRGGKNLRRQVFRRLRHVVPAAAMVVAALALAWFKVADQDVFWHLKVGEVILDTGRLVTTNVFSSLFPDHPWFNPEWGFQVLLANAYRQSGRLGMALLKLLLVAAMAVAL